MHASISQLVRGFQGYPIAIDVRGLVRRVASMPEASELRHSRREGGVRGTKTVASMDGSDVDGRSFEYAST